MTAQPAGVRACAPGPRFEAIANRGNRDLPDGGRDNWIVCADGATLSVLAWPGAYSTPRVAPSGCGPLPSLGEEPYGYPGPYTAVEVGYPDPRPEPSVDWAGDGDYGVYGYVPVQAVRDYIAQHGGEAPAGAVAPTPPLSAAEAATVARFDAAPALPELDEERVEDLAEVMARYLTGYVLDELDAATQAQWLAAARYALSVPGVAR